MKGMYEHMTKTDEQSKTKYKPVSSLTLNTELMDNLSSLMEIHQNSVGENQTKFLEHIAKKVIAGDYVGLVKPKPNKKKRISFYRPLLNDMKETAKEMGYEHKISNLFDDIIEYEFNNQIKVNLEESLEKVRKNREEFENVGGAKK